MKGKKVLQIDRETNEVIAEYASIADAGRAMMHGDPSSIRRVCDDAIGKRTWKNRCHTAYGYKWRYKDEN